MNTFKSFEDDLYQVNERNFRDIALALCRFQIENNVVYREFATHLGREKPTSFEDIPFLPISFFKTHEIKTGVWNTQEEFTSSGTTGQTSRHPVRNTEVYLKNSEKIFNDFFGPLTNYHVLALLPSYLEREGSSLVSMADHFINASRSEYSGFYLSDTQSLIKTLHLLRNSEKKVILLGVTFALLDLAESQPLDLSHCLVMETGGMKGRRPEITRVELHRFLCERFNIPSVLSEYGMTELFSQAYSFGQGKFRTPETMKIIIRDINDPFSTQIGGRTGGLNIIDLANFHSCAFIESQDLGKIHQDGNFEVLGRMDNSDIRGCNLLVE